MPHVEADELALRFCQTLCFAGLKVNGIFSNPACIVAAVAISRAKVRE